MTAASSGSYDISGEERAQLLMFEVGASEGLKQAKLQPHAGLQASTTHQTYAFRNLLFAFIAHG
jgi:hypothetical protein